MKRAVAANALQALAATPSALPVVPLRRDDLPVETVALARYMVGKYLVHDLPEGRLVGRLVEVEGYPPGDSTGHAFIGPRGWNASLFLARGHAYVRLTYGLSYMLNMSSEAEGVGAGVLFRAVEPLEGLASMAARRPGATLRDLTRGPGRLTQAFGIGASFDGIDLCAGKSLWIGRLNAARHPAAEPGVTTRIGLSREQDRPLRFYEIGSPFVSGPRKLLSTS
ncbi:DNA-3-methyladenine glycosylase [Paraburkholderia eburnea]|uniref:Putative 3-methyladenine DNA glycosylase n=1 Tax=Paraburkholderia eburnea TaxID=1189126 RepID=A0A2S4LZP2_9BURK|nr:DNA-3-methyladenine glycosylase [Paraburkholderia eburnea]POR47942.1 DNA-3-methyladenine glycosylase [Paraburkholderia eburnea]PRZ19336.1 DNA-3-methyladenine glycosylase [Paraburkholderia eburnea]